MAYAAPTLPAADEKTGVFVAPHGSPTNPGTRAAPLDSPKLAIEQAAAGGQVVFLAAGEYGGEFVAKVSLFGGYSPDFSELDPVNYATILKGPDGVHSSTALTIEAGEILVHGLSLRGGKGKHATAVRIEAKARATLVRNRLFGGGRGPTSESFTYSHGIRTPAGAAPVFSLLGNEIHGGVNQYSWGIDGPSTACVMIDNTIHGGDARTPNASTSGLRGYGAFVLRGNTITGGMTVGGDGWVIEGNTFTGSRGKPEESLLIRGEGGRLVGNTFDGVPDESLFGFVKQLAPRTWIFNRVEGHYWSYDQLTLHPWGWLDFTSDSSTEPTGGGYGGPSQSFRDFLARGPAEASTPPEVVAEVRELLLAAGVR